MSNKVCPCVGELLATMVAIEALEHNAQQSKLWMELGETLQRENKPLFEELSLSYPLDYPILEPLAEWGLGSWLSKVEDDCHINTDDIRKLLSDASKEMKERKPRNAYFRYVDAKMKLLDRATEVCKED